jgi:hypothetical protein
VPPCDAPALPLVVAVLRVLVASVAASPATLSPCRGQTGQTPAEMGAMDSTDHPSAMLAHQAI